MIKVIVFDFDGVITERGEALKEEAWENLPLDPAEALIQSSFMAALLSERRLLGQGKAKGDRYSILRNTLKVVGCSESDLEQKVALYAKRYNDNVQRLIQSEPMSSRAEDGLSMLSNRSQLFVNTATPTEAVKESLRNLGIAKYFADVLGSEHAKLKNLASIAERQGVSPAEMIFIGDSDDDIKAAQAFGCMFIGRRNDWNKWTSEKPFPIISSLTEIEALIQEL
ncbi:HAD hydrolase-like protein [Candidatus Parcubacteria bacterium]|nr:HAD hydrolase-like protein [Candidatus Parcubacteria bacterium]